MVLLSGKFCTVNIFCDFRLVIIMTELDGLVLEIDVYKIQLISGVTINALMQFSAAIILWCTVL